jgi:hypothetical protein
VTRAVLQAWSAWAPERVDAASWRRWARAPEPLGPQGRPEASFLPSLLRRRCSALARIMLTVAFDCVPAADRDRVRTVFASRHGNINESIDLLMRLARRQPLSPTRFSHSVHNAQAGLYSIAAENRRPSSSISAQEDTFACGYLEALTHLARAPEDPVLLVVADVPLAETFAAMVDEPAASYGVALLLAARGPGAALDFEVGPGEGDAETLPWPDAAEFVRWLLDGERRLRLGCGRRRWTWTRLD